ncbi:hypothetical protein [Flagellimonas sp.]|uniref:hypothetical protein n=1 Tax=Flagellimonas sp. TaxID=2058762 RepID=UPI003B5A1AF8
MHEFRLHLLILILFCACQPQNHTNEGWQKVYQNDALGKTTFGDKSQLIDAVRLGYPVRIGWGSTQVEHVTDASFITIIQGKEVFAQINTIIGQAPQIQGGSFKIGFRAQNYWTKIAGTNGYSTSLATDYFKDSILGGNSDNASATTWYVFYPRHQSKMEALPLWKKESPNWKAWNNTKEKDAAP